MNNLYMLSSPTEISNDIAKRVKACRKAEKLTQKELAARANVSLGSLKRFEQSGEISLAALIRISFVLNHENDFSLLFTRKEYSSIQEIIDEQI